MGRKIKPRVWKFQKMRFGDFSERELGIFEKKKNWVEEDGFLDLSKLMNWGEKLVIWRRTHEMDKEENGENDEEKLLNGDFKAGNTLF